MPLSVIFPKSTILLFTKEWYIIYIYIFFIHLRLNVVECPSKSHNPTFPSLSLGTEKPQNV